MGILMTSEHVKKYLGHSKDLIPCSYRLIQTLNMNCILYDYSQGLMQGRRHGGA